MDTIIAGRTLLNERRVRKQLNHPSATERRWKTEGNAGNAQVLQMLAITHIFRAYLVADFFDIPIEKPIKLVYSDCH
jgi:hypothetical protein